MRYVVHAGPEDQSWRMEVFAVNENGNYVSQETDLFETKELAKASGIEKAKVYKAEFTLFGSNHIIQEKNSYGSDPYPPRG